MSELPTVAPTTDVHDDECSDVNLNDPFRPAGPYGIAKSCEARIAKLEAEKDALPRSKHKAINRRLRELRDLMEWCRTRAGYVEP